MEKKINHLETIIKANKYDIEEYKKQSEYWFNEYNKLKKEGTTKKHNARGAGRKKQITEKQIAMIKMLRCQGMTLQAIQIKLNISYGNIQKYSK